MQQSRYRAFGNVFSNVENVQLPLVDLIRRGPMPRQQVVAHLAHFVDPVGPRLHYESTLLVKCRAVVGFLHISLFCMSELRFEHVYVDVQTFATHRS